ncbi:MAG: CoA ester lyase [Rhodobacteraceae bacterium]|nr:CoA ester lyase [Paracoccaceae bacterium]
MSHPYRSVLYLPGSRSRVLEKAKNLPADALIFDLEDAVAPEDKPTARALVGGVVQSGYGERKCLIRINGQDTPWGEADLLAAIAAEPDGILVPKVESADELQAIAARLKGKTRLWAMMETPLGILNVQQIAASTPALEGFVIGTNDLVKSLFASHMADRAPVMTALSLCLLAARAYGLVCIDGVFNAFKDEDGLRAECLQGLALGFDGKSLIHPAQINVTNEVFSPNEAALDLARRYINAFENASGVAVVDGRIVENLHVENAVRLLAKADRIAQMNSKGDET